MIRLLPREAVLPTARIALGAHPDGVDLVAQALRRGSALLAPASRSDLIRFVSEPLVELGIDRADVEDVLDGILSYGDILEMRRLDSDPWDAPEQVLRPAPPAFVHRANGDFIILGTAGDMPSALTPDLDARITANSNVRVIRPEPNEYLEAHLRLLGLVKLSEQAWLRLPNSEDAASHVARWTGQLRPLADGEIANATIEILDPTRNVHFYRGRWISPNASIEGLHIARRPQLYGAPLWCLLEFSGGQAIRWLDFGPSGDRQRPCEIAWRVQAAIDARRGAAQVVRVGRAGEQTRFDFFSPLPGFAERQLALVGDKCPGVGSLFGFVIDDKDAARELESLRNLLWMRAVNHGDGL
jgi:hypothetical protein